MVLDNIIISLQLLHQEILDIYRMELNPMEKWTKIAIQMHNKNDIIVKSFLELKKESVRKEISLDYSANLKILETRIKSEADLVVKSSLIITSLHIILYDLLSNNSKYSKYRQIYIYRIECINIK